MNPSSPSLSGWSILLQTVKGASRSLILFSCFLILTCSLSPAQQNGIAQDSEIITTPAGDRILRWYGHAGRSYFIQVSDQDDPLRKWNWAPIIEGGADGYIEHLIGGTASKAFVRLKYTSLTPGPNETLDTADFDQDGLSNLSEIAPPPPLLPKDATDPLDPDTDDDGLTDGYERDNGLDPNDPGTGNPDNGPNGDPDDDGLTNTEEQAFGTNPTDSDSDDDGTSDGDEVEQGTDPKNANDFPVKMISMARGALGGDGISAPSEVQTSGHGVYLILNDGDQTDNSYYSYQDSHYLSRMLNDLGNIVYPDEPESNSNRFSRSTTLDAYSGYFNQEIDGGEPYETEDYEVELGQKAIWIEAPPSPIEKKRIFLKVSISYVYEDDWENYDFLTGDLIEVQREERVERVTITTAPNKRYSERYNLSFPVEMTVVPGEDHVQEIHTLLIPMEVTAAFGIGPEAPDSSDQTSQQLLETYLDGIKFANQGDLWAVIGKNGQGNQKIWGVEIVTEQEKLKAALSAKGQYVVFDGHANHGLGPEFPKYAPDGGIIPATKIEDYTNFGVGYTALPTANRKTPDFEGGLEVSDDEIPDTPLNYKPLPINVERFPNIDGVGVDEAFIKLGEGFDTWHYYEDWDIEIVIIDAPKTDLPANLGYKTFFYNACKTGINYIENFKHGDFIYTNNFCFVHQGTRVFVQGVVEGKTSLQIKDLLNQQGVGSNEEEDTIYEFHSF